MDAQPNLPTFQWPALVAGPIFLTFELRGTPGHKARHRSRIVIPKGLWVHTQRSSFIPKEKIRSIFIQQYPDPDTEAYEATLAEVATLFMRGKPPTERPVALMVHSFRKIPASWSKTETAKALAGAIRPTTKPDWDNHAKVTDALNGIVWKDDSQVVDGRSIKVYSETPALRIEVREMVPPSE